MSNKIVLSTGSNKGDRRENLEWAKNELIKSLGNLLSESGLYESVSWGFDGCDFYNQILIFETSLPPKDCLKVLLQTEKKRGRLRNDDGTYNDRSIDLDIIFYNDEIINQRGLHIPHPKMQERNFVLKPMVELMPEFVHPLLNKSMVQLLSESKDEIKAEVVS